MPDVTVEAFGRDEGRAWMRVLLDINLFWEAEFRWARDASPVGHSNKNTGYPHVLGEPLANLSARIMWLRNQLGEGCIDRGTTIRIEEINTMGRRKTNEDKAARRAANREKRRKAAEEVNLTARQMLVAKLNQTRAIKRILAERAAAAAEAEIVAAATPTVNLDGEPAQGTQGAPPLSEMAFPIVDREPPGATDGAQ